MRVLVLRALGLGDLLTSLPALRAVRRAFPQAQVVLAAPLALRELALHCGAVDEVVDAAPLAPLPRSVHGCDVGVNLHGRGPQSTAVLLAASPARVLSHGLEGSRPWDPDEHEVLRWCRLLEHHGVPADPTDLLLEPVPLTPAATGAVLVHPGAAQRSRHWPVERWARVARGLAADGHDVRITGSAAEAPLAGRVARDAGLALEHVLAGSTGLLELAALVSRSRLLVSVDTGVAHLATAVGTPSVVLFGPTPPSLWGPPPDRPQHRALWAGRTGDNFAPEPDPGLLEITSDEVLDAARQALAQVPAPGQPAGQVVRTRRPDDLPVLLALLQRTHEQEGYPVRAAAVRADWLASADELVGAVAVDGTRVVGHVALHPVDEADDSTAVRQWRQATGRTAEGLAVVSRLFTDRSVPGTGTALLSHAVARAAGLGRTAVLKVDPDSAARGFYVRRGWREVGTARQQWGSRTVDAVLMVPGGPRP